MENHDQLMAQYAGVIDTLALLYQRGHPLGVVTSKGNMMMERGLKFIGADDYIGSGDVGTTPSTSINPIRFPAVRAALEKLEYKADEAVFVGDLPHDIQSGNDAGVIHNCRAGGPSGATS